MATFEVKTIIASIQKLQDNIKKTEAQIMDSNISERLKYAHEMVDIEDRLEEIIRHLKKDPTYIEDTVAPTKTTPMSIFQRFKANSQQNISPMTQKAIEAKEETHQLDIPTDFIVPEEDQVETITNDNTTAETEKPVVDAELEAAEKE